MEEMGLYEDVSGARGASVEVTVTPTVSDVIQQLHLLLLERNIKIYFLQLPNHKDVILLLIFLVSMYYIPCNLGFHNICMLSCFVEFKSCSIKVCK